MAKKKKGGKSALKAKAAPKEAETEELDSQDEYEEEDEAPVAKKKKSSSKESKDSGGSVYKIIEVVGSSTKSWEHAAQVAVDRASRTLEDLRVAEVVDQDLKIEDGKIASYRTKLRLSFKFRD